MRLGGIQGFVLLCLITLLAAACGANNSKTPDEVVETFFKQVWLNRDYDKAKTMVTDHVSKKEISKEVEELPDKRKQHIRRDYLMYREMDNKNQETKKVYMLLASNYERRIKLYLKKSEGKWKVDQIQSKPMKKYDEDQLNQYEWKGSEIQGKIE
ncbi:hypothetical protein [Paludifilum halophilum]|uniref:DUF4878 domain-containing protein n=1 Tax=Paludifilum halophilum TaxID=1642702 RepID=A0A235B598_9BACL|nr:hypothetical protein [Paludifilum halophilum]OYD07463.1 hypothetical protein CHM34_11215 [Paludifilum halophilum]